MMNSKTLLGDSMPTGGRRIWWNCLMATSTIIATSGSIWVLSNKGTPGMIGITILVTLFVLGLVGFFRKNSVKA
jgi:hypothetical protein